MNQDHFQIIGDCDPCLFFYHTFTSQRLPLSNCSKLNGFNTENHTYFVLSALVVLGLINLSANFWVDTLSG